MKRSIKVTGSGRTGCPVVLSVFQLGLAPETRSNDVASTKIQAFADEFAGSTVFFAFDVDEGATFFDLTNRLFSLLVAGSTVHLANHGVNQMLSGILRGSKTFVIA